VWVAITSYFEAKGLVRQQLDSFNDFVKYTLPEIVTGTEDIILAPTHQSDKAEQKVGGFDWEISVLFFFFSDTVA
jgi:DNA-directed RNA polymerase II subunit RPB2